ncbi:hypothetical protein BB561_005413 [Smittium simulii]|uniref:Retrotransposon gag domain-containing protein n=1 Tax=Smittium simulii TaxID=133385 RepID=A0A2T9YAN2_9FUNG|nr:hypothetical protein BB561_005413 [Smittium simulii]
MSFETPYPFLSFPRWFNGCKDEQKEFGIQNKEQFVLLLARQLKSNARQVYDSCRDREGILFTKTLSSFKETMGPKFVDCSYDIKLRYNLLNLKQKSSISKYIEQEKDLFGNYESMSEKNRIFYLMNNMKPAYLNILNKQNPSTYMEAIDLLIHKGNVLNMNAELTVAKRNDDNMEIDAVFAEEKLYNNQAIGINLINIDNGGKTFWVTVREAKTPIPLLTSHNSTKNFLENARMCWNCGNITAKQKKKQIHRCGKSESLGVNVFVKPDQNFKINQEHKRVEVKEVSLTPEKFTKTSPPIDTGKVEWCHNSEDLNELLNDQDSDLDLELVFYSENKDV